jgi:hypothetical protein
MRILLKLDKKSVWMQESHFGFVFAKDEGDVVRLCCKERGCGVTMVVNGIAYRSASRYTSIEARYPTGGITEEGHKGKGHPGNEPIHNHEPIVYF